MESSWSTYGEALDSYTLPSFIASTPIAIVLFEEAAPAAVHPCFWAHFTKAYGKDYRFGRLRMSRLPYKGALAPVVVSVLPKGSLTEKTGFYLFLGGRAVKYHPGTDNVDNPAAGLIDVAMMIASGPGGDIVLERYAKDVLKTFDPLVSAHMLKHTRSVGRRFADESSVQSKALDPYAILGVPRRAEKAEVDSAFKKLRAEYSVDRLEGMHGELRRIAEDRSREVNLARDAIYKDRDW